MNSINNAGFIPTNGTMPYQSRSKRSGKSRSRRIRTSRVGIVVVLIIIALFVILYIINYMRDIKALPEGMCGGNDQMCQCAGNETMISNPGVPQDFELQKLLVGY